MGFLGKLKRLISFKVLHEKDLKPDELDKDVPVIVVVGTSGVGKTQFIRTLSQAYDSEFKSSTKLEPHTKRIAIVRCEIGGDKEKQDIRTRVILVDTPPQLDEADAKSGSGYKDEVSKISRLFPTNPIYVLYLFNSTDNRAPNFPMYRTLSYTLCGQHRNHLFLAGTMWDKSSPHKEARFPQWEGKWQEAWKITGLAPEEGGENLRSASKYNNTQASALELVDTILNSGVESG